MTYMKPGQKPLHGVPNTPLQEIPQIRKRSSNFRGSGARKLFQPTLSAKPFAVWQKTLDLIVSAK
jgi:hypothetical protein